MSDRALDGLGPEHVRVIRAEEALTRAKAALEDAKRAVDKAAWARVSAWEELSDDDAEDVALALRHLENLQAQA